MGERALGVHTRLGQRLTRPDPAPLGRAGGPTRAGGAGPGARQGPPTTRGATAASGSSRLEPYGEAARIASQTREAV